MVELYYRKAINLLELAMNLNSFIRLSGVALIKAGILLLIWWLGLGIFMPTEGIDIGFQNMVVDGNWLWINVIGVIACMLLIAGFYGLYLKQADQSGVLGYAGFLCAFFGSVLFLCIQYIETVIWPMLAEHAPTLLQHNGPMFADGVFNFQFIQSLSDLR